MSEQRRELSHWHFHILKLIVSLLLFAMMMLTFIDVIGRYLLNSPIFGAAEIIQFLLAGTVFSGMVLVSHEDKHVAVELFAPALRAQIPRTHQFIVVLFSTVGLLIIGLELTRITLHALEVGRLTIVLEWPIAIVSGPSAFFCYAAALVQALWLIRRNS
jgi:TRAP-type C4-dicarboxylate transport system permease small subunit